MTRWLQGIIGLLLAGMATTGVVAAELPNFDATQLRRIQSHGPWPPAHQPDRSNRYSGNPEAVRLGAVLFDEPRLSGAGGIACQTCHRPERGWSDGLPRSRGMALLERNAPSLLDSRLQRWFGWDGANDSLWAASIRPILDPREMAGDPAAVARLLRGDRQFACLVDRMTATRPTDDEAWLVLAAKALAAFQEILVSPRTPFDLFRDALLAEDEAGKGRYPAAAQRGLALFIGRGQCATCHSGPAFTNGEFHDTGLPFFIRPAESNGPRRVDPGRYGGITQLQSSPFNRIGSWTDDPADVAVIPVRHVRQFHRNWGEFKVPGLRHLAATAPYMHDGSKADLRAVILHYSNLDEDRLHADGEAILKPLRLSDAEIDDMLAFLATLEAPLQPVATQYDDLRRQAAAICP